MKLRFEIDQDGERPAVVTIQVRVSSVTPRQWRFLADRLEGIDVVKLHYDPRTRKPEKTYYADNSGQGAPKRKPVLIRANAATFDALMAAVEANDAEVSPRDLEALKGAKPHATAND